MDEGQGQHTKKANTKRRRWRDYGSVSVRLKNGAWHLQYRNGDGKIKSEVLVRRDDVYYSAMCDAVKELAAKRLAELIPKTTGAKPDMRVGDFWEQVYTPWAKETNPLVGEPNLRASTLSGYEQIWERHLKAHFGDNQPHLITGVGHFLSPGEHWVCQRHPWAGAFSRLKTKAPAKTRHYTLKEVLAILTALDEHPEYRLVMALAFFAGLRPGEIRGLRIEDFTSETSEECPVCQEEQWDISVAHFHVRRNIDKAGNTTALKAPESEGPLPLMVPIPLAFKSISSPAETQRLALRDEKQYARQSA